MLQRTSSFRHIHRLGIPSCECHPRGAQLQGDGAASQFFRDAGGFFRSGCPQDAGRSRCDAFGVQNNARYSGLVESEGLSTRTRIKNAVRIQPENSSITPTPDEQGNGIPTHPAFAVAVASLGQALQSPPDLTEASKHIVARETEEGLNINIVDQDGTSMFQEGSREPYQRIRQLLQMIAGPLKAAPYRISITGHTEFCRFTARLRRRQSRHDRGCAAAVAGLKPT